MVIFAFAIFFFIKTAIHGVNMWLNVRSNKSELAANVFPLLTLLTPKLYNEEGKMHQKAFNSNLVKFLVCFAAIVVIFILAGIK